MPGVMAYGATREPAIAAVRALALRVAADCIDHGAGDSRTVHQGLFGGMSRWRSVKAKQLLAALLRIEWAVASRVLTAVSSDPAGPTTHLRSVRATWDGPLHAH